VEFALAVGLLLLPVAMAVLAFGPWSERRVVAEASAAEAARTAVVSLDLSRGSQVVSEIASNHSLPADAIELGWCGSEPAPAAVAVSGCSLARGSEVVAEVRIWAPLISTPWGSVGGLWVTGVHAEPVDFYRSLG
jgi:Flp pilus assembly protein CpaB